MKTTKMQDGKWAGMTWTESDFPLARKQVVKIQNHIIRGQSLPPHLGIAWGRHIFALMHLGINNGLWLRDLPLSLDSLAREYGFHEPIQAYLMECRRTGQQPQI